MNEIMVENDNLISSILLSVRRFSSSSSPPFIGAIILILHISSCVSLFRVTVFILLFLSPLVGFMADSIPIYGPKGANGSLPEGLDQCNGHASDLPFYHYHFTSNYPYAVDCLWGQLDGSWYVRKISF